jgi:ribonuclease Z
MRTGEATLADGRVVHIEDISSDYRKPVLILFVDIESLADLEKIPDPSEFSVIVHFTDPAVLQQDAYIDRFPATALNLCFFEDDSAPLTSGMGRYQRYRRENPRLFPELAREFADVDELKHFVAVAGGDSVELGDEELHLTRTSTGRCEPVAPVIPACPTFHVTFLGTSSGFVFPERTTSVILVQTAQTFILLDAGLGCYSQLRRHYGRANAASILSRLGCIWISHFHLDHIGGLIRLLLERSKVTPEPILLCCCDGLLAELHRIEAHYPGGFHIQPNDRTQPITIYDALLESIPVRHCDGAMGCVLTFDGGLRLAFSGDQIADGTFAEAVGRCDVLIHEATYDSDKSDAAIARGHSTIGTALESGNRMQARFVFLTHFSAGMGAEPPILEPENAICAFDHLSVAYEDMEEAFQVCKKMRLADD